MPLIKNLLTAFLMPPGLFSALAFCLAVLLRRDRKQAFAWVVFALLIWVASMGLVGNIALARLEYAYLPTADLKADAIVVLNGGIMEGTPEPFGVTELTSVSLDRVIAAAGLYRVSKLPILVTGGTLYSMGSEATAMKKSLMSLGVPQEKVFVEDRSRDTMENAVFSKQICDEKGYKKIALVTSASHMKRAVWSFEKAGFKDIFSYPAAYKTIKPAKYGLAGYLPGTGDNLRIALHEYLGLVFYKIKYRRD